MTLIKTNNIPAPVANTLVAAPVAAPVAGPSVADLLAQLAAAQAAVAAEKARADAAIAAQKNGRGYSLKVSDKTGIICIGGVSAAHPLTVYAPHLVGIVTDLVLTGKLAGFMRENDSRLSVKVNGVSQVATDDSRAEVRRLADRLDSALAARK